MSHVTDTPTRRWTRPAVVTLLPAALIFLAYLVNSRNAYDFSLDEVTYATVTQRIADDNAISTLANPFLVHPPFYFLLASLWELITGHRGDSPLDTIYSLRYLQALLIAAASWVVGLVTSEAIRSTGREVRLRMPIAAMLVFAFSGFVLSFGRAVILEPGALLAGGLVLLAALKLRDRSAGVQIATLGALIGVGCLVKQTVVFVALALLLAAFVRREWRRFGHYACALVVGGVVWGSFLVWGAIEGLGGRFIDQQTVSLQRLTGVLQTSGVNRPKASGTAGPLDDIRDTFVQYLAGYVVFVAGALALLVLVARRRLFSRTDRLPLAHHLVLAFGVLEYAFVTFSFAFGQGNEQLIMYSAPAAAIAIGYVVATREPAGVRVGLDRVLAPAVAAIALVGLVVGLGTWGYYYVANDDNATTRMAAYVNRTTDGCVAVNATGNTERWSQVLPDKLVTGYDNTTGGLQNDTRLYLVSSKDASHAYGNMSPQFAATLRRDGELLHRVDSRSYGTISLYRIGPASAVQAQPAKCAASDARRRAVPPVEASAIVFTSLLAGILVIVAAGGAIVARRQRSAADAAPEREPEPAISG